MPRFHYFIIIFTVICLSSIPLVFSQTLPMKGNSATQKAIFGGGCFWCTEAVFRLANGVLSVTPGYAGGHFENPTYEDVCSGKTGHAEVILVEFDPTKISYRQLLDLFWETHDPTTLNRQGADVGTQYRSIIISLDEKQRSEALTSKTAAQAKFKNPIVTEITEASVFYPAEKYHHDFYRRNPFHPYNRAVIKPKVEKLTKSI